MVRRPPLSLRGQALAWLAQRDRSRLELKRKLIQRLRRQAHLAAAAASPSADGAETAEGRPTVDLVAVEALLDEFEAAGHLSDVRFVESRVHLRAARFGSRRIEQELRRLGAPMDDDTRSALAATEVERARRVWAVKFGRPPADAADRARQARFMAGRGFSGDSIRKVLASAGDEADDLDGVGAAHDD